MLARRLVDSLYVEAMVLADEARSYFDAGFPEACNPADGDAPFDPFERVVFSCESLKVTTRLMHVIAWLLTQRAVDAGELERASAQAPSRRLGPAIHSDESVLLGMPEEARKLVAGSLDLYRRVERLDAGLDETATATSPARHLLHRLNQAF